MSEGTEAIHSTPWPPTDDPGDNAPAAEPTGTADVPGTVDEAVAAAEVAGDGTLAALDEAEAAMREAAGEPAPEEIAAEPRPAAGSLTAPPATPSLEAAQPRPEVAAAPVAPAVESRPAAAAVTAADAPREAVTWDLPEAAAAPDAAAPEPAAAPDSAAAAEPAEDVTATVEDAPEPAREPVTWDVPAPVHPAPAGPGAVGPTPAVQAAGSASAAAPSPTTPTPTAPSPTATRQAAPTPGALRPPTPSALRPQPGGSGPAAPAGGRGEAPTATAPAPGVEPVVPASDPHEFGYVGEDAWIFLRTAEGDRPIAQWAAGDPEEGLAFFGRKYDDLVVELELAERRLKDGKANPEQAAQAVKRVREALVEPAFVGDVAGLAARCEQLEGLVKERRQQVQAERLAAKAEALAVREQIVAEAESLVASTQWKATGDRFRTLLDEWKAAPRVDRAKEQELWKRFSHARSAFDKTRRQHFAQLDAQRKDAVAAKEAIVAEAEALSASSDWGPTARAYRTLMDRWKASPRASRQDEDRLWQRFRAAQDQFFSARNGVMETRDADLRENLDAKEAILAEAEALLPITDLKAAKASLRVLQERWEKVGHVPRGDKERVEGRMRRVEDALRKAEQDEWRRTNPEARARAEATASQFRASVEKLEAALAKAQAAGDQRAIADAERSLATTRALLEAAEGAADEFSG